MGPNSGLSPIICFADHMLRQYGRPSAHDVASLGETCFSPAEWIHMDAFDVYLVLRYVY